LTAALIKPIESSYVALYTEPFKPSVQPDGHSEQISRRIHGKDILHFVHLSFCVFLE